MGDERRGREILSVRVGMWEGEGVGEGGVSGVCVWYIMSGGVRVSLR